MAGDLSPYRQKLKQLANRYDRLFTQRKAVINNYEQAANAAVGNLLSQFSPVAAQAFAQAEQLGDAYTQDFLPATQKYLSDAQGYDTADRRTSERGRAMADVTTASDAARKGAIERLEAFGIDPSQTRGAALDANIRLQSALAAVKAGDDAEKSVEERGMAYRRDALGLGGELLAGQTALQRTGQSLTESGVEAQNRTSANNVGMFSETAGLLQGRQSALNSAAQLRLDENAQQLAAKGGGGSALGSIGGVVGTLGGAALGAYLGPAGSTAGAALGAQIGSNVGSMGGSALGRSRSGGMSADYLQ
jgi:hypothetical protein